MGCDAETIDALPVNCAHKARGCEEKVKRGDLETHAATCGFAEVTCTHAGCGATVLRRNLEAHVASCEWRVGPCLDGCGMDVCMRDFPRHFAEECRKRVVRCGKCGTKREAEGMEEHRRQCPERKVECEFAGCGVMYKLRARGEHMKENAERHVALLQASIKGLKESFAARTQRRRENAARALAEINRLERVTAKALCDALGRGPLTPATKAHIEKILARGDELNLTKDELAALEEGLRIDECRSASRKRAREAADADAPSQTGLSDSIQAYGDEPKIEPPLKQFRGAADMHATGAEGAASAAVSPCQAAPWQEWLIRTVAEQIRLINDLSARLGDPAPAVAPPPPTGGTTAPTLNTPAAATLAREESVHSGNVLGSQTEVPAAAAAEGSAQAAAPTEERAVFTAPSEQNQRAQPPNESVPSVSIPLLK